MSSMIDYVDIPGKACWSSVLLDSGEPIWISIAQNGIMVKQSRLGILGTKLFHETNMSRCVDVADALHRMIDFYTTPDGLQNPVLRVFTQTALNSRTSKDFATFVSNAKQQT